MQSLTKKEFEWDLVGEKKTYVIAQKISNLTLNKSSKRHGFPLLEQAASTIRVLLVTTKLCVPRFHT